MNNLNNRKISVIIPCFNEEKTISQNIKKVFNYLNGRFTNFEIIVVNDGSTDKTLTQLKTLQLNIPLKIINHQINEGKGKAIKDGALHSQYNLLLFLDADLAIPIEELDKFLKELNNGYDLVIASRFLPGSKKILPVKWYREIMEKIFRILRIIILNEYEIKDTQCGFKLFTKEVAQKIFPISKIDRFAFDAELIFLAKKLNFKIKELPTTLQNPIESHVNFFYDPLNMFFDLIRIKLNYLFKKYHLLL